MVRPTKKQILRAVEKIAIGECVFACEALGSVNMEWNIESEFSKFYDYPTNYSYHGWFGSPTNEENQLARSLALLLYAEAREDIL